MGSHGKRRLRVARTEGGHLLDYDRRTDSFKTTTLCGLDALDMLIVRSAREQCAQCGIARDQRWS